MFIQCPMEGRSAVNCFVTSLLKGNPRFGTRAKKTSRRRCNIGDLLPPLTVPSHGEQNPSKSPLRHAEVERQEHEAIAPAHLVTKAVKQPVVGILPSLPPKNVIWYCSSPPPLCSHQALIGMFPLTLQDNTCPEGCSHRWRIIQNRNWYHRMKSLRNVLYQN